MVISQQKTMGKSILGMAFFSLVRMAWSESLSSGTNSDKLTWPVMACDGLWDQPERFLAGYDPSIYPSTYQSICTCLSISISGFTVEIRWNNADRASKKGDIHFAGQ
jgi:hypothetical protein